MAIIKTIKEEPYKEGLRWQYPDQFVSEAEKNTDAWWKKSMDYWYTIALGQYSHNQTTFIRNYRLLKGFLDKTDFYQEEKSKMVLEAQELMDTLEDSLDLPSYVKHYPILNPPINTMVGEMTKRPDNAHIKAFDDESQGEQMQAMTDMFQQYMEQIISQKVAAKLQAQGQDTSDLEALQEQQEQITEEQMKSYRTSYTSMAERWGSKMLEALKMNFNVKEKSEEAFRDLLITAREFVHIHPDGSKMGFALSMENAKNVWFLTTDGKKYTRDAYAAGTIHVMELSEILNTYPFLTKEEIERLNTQARRFYDNPISYKSPLVQKNPVTGVNSIDYHVYDPAIEGKRREMENAMMESELDNYMGISSSIGHYGNKFVVVKSYWQSKKKMGKLTYMDEDGIPQTELVDESYKKIPEEITIEWGYINQWYEGLKIGDEIYYVNPLELLPYCPIIGVVHENKNTPPASLVDLMKPYQILYNVCMNQLYRLLEKDTGKVFLTDIRQVPTPKDGDNQDALSQWMLDAQEMGVIFLDNSPDNTKGPSNFNQHSVQDMSRASEMQIRMQLAEQLKNECWELVGLTRQRLGGTTSSETATSINTALTQSYAQTEVYFVQHEYLWNQIYQALLDAAMHVELEKPESTVSFISGEGEHQFIRLNREDLLLRDLQVFVTSRAEDQRIFNELRSLAQPMLQNGAGFDVVLNMYTTNSVRQLKDSINSFQRKKEQLEQQQVQQKQQEMEQQQSQFEAQMQQAQADKQADVENENYNKDMDRINKKEIAVISALGFGKQNGEDNNANGVPDIYEMKSLEQSQLTIQNNHQIALQKQQLATQQHQSDNAIKQQQIALQEEKIKLQREHMKSQERMNEEKLKVQKIAKKSPAKKK